MRVNKKLTSYLYSALAAFCLLAAPAAALERPTFDDFYACWEKNKSSVLTYEGLPAFALSENELAVVRLPNTKLNSYVKFDPFLNLYLVRTDFSLIAPIFGDERERTRADWTGIIDEKKPYIGHIKYLALGLYERDKLDYKSKIGLLNSPCCKALGIALDNGSFIGWRYLQHFKAYNEVYWGDIGASFHQRADKIYVDSITTNTKLQLNDEVLSIDGNPVKDVRELNEKILFAPNQSTLYLKILRDNEELEISTLVQPKIYAQPEFASKKSAQKASVYASSGVSLSTAQVIIKLSKTASAQGFMLGDKILAIDGVETKTREQVLKLLPNARQVLIERDIKDQMPSGKFHFFITIRR